MDAPTKPRTYRGVTIERTPSGGWWVAFITGYGYVKADTIAGIRGLIADALGDS